MECASQQSQRHVGAVTDRMVKDLHEAGIRGARVEAARQADWALIDDGDIIDLTAFLYQRMRGYCMGKSMLPVRD